MKNSNKLLLGGFLTVILLITAIHITLYAKYKNGDYTVFNAGDDQAPHSMQSFPNITFVSMRNVADARVEFGDVAQVEKGGEEAIQYVQKGDTLLITHNDDQQDTRHYTAINLPYNVRLSVFNSSISFKTGKKIAENNPVIYLQKSVALFSGNKNPLLFGHMKVVMSDSSAALFQGNTQVNNLEVQLSNSAIEYTAGDFGQLSIVTDSVSRISLQSKHLLKAKITITPNE